MKIIELEEKTEEWYQWRNNHLGASDAPAIMGASPWETRYGLWEIKTGRKENEFKTNPAMEKGIREEPIAREFIEKIENKKYSPICIESSDYPFLSASLDGYNKETNTVLEIKTLGDTSHGYAIEGNIPEVYYWQLCHQMLVSGADRAIYLSWVPYNEQGERGDPIGIYKDRSFFAEGMEEIKKELLDFHSAIVNNDPPEMTDRDWALIRKPKGVTSLFRETIMHIPTGNQWNCINAIMDILGNLPDGRHRILNFRITKDNGLYNFSFKEAE